MRKLSELTTIDLDLLNNKIKTKWSEIVEGKSLQNVYTPSELVVEMLSKVETHDDMDILVMSNLDIYSCIIYLKTEGFIKYKSIKVITDVIRENNPDVITMNLNDIKNLELDMKFDLVIGNPPFNIVDLNSKKLSKEKTGLAGDKQTYRTFTKHGLRFLKKDGRLLFVTPKQIYGLLIKDKELNQYQVESFNFMDNKIWKYNTAWFTLLNSPRVSKINIDGKTLTNTIYNKALDSTNTFKVQCVARKKRDFYNKFITSEEFSIDTPYKIICGLPGDVNRGKAATTQTQYSNNEGKASGNWKLIFTLLHSELSLIVSDLGVIGDNEGYVLTKNEIEALNLKNFMKSKLIKFLIRTLNLSRGHYELLKYLKTVPLSNINCLDDQEIYNYFNLTLDEIQLIENTIK
jgi:hypothetical protein